MTTHAAPKTALPAQAVAGADLARIDRATAFVRAHDTRSALAELLPDLDESELTSLGRHLRLAHTAVLVFPPSLEALRAELADRGMTPGETVPSVVVRQRLASRYRRPTAELEVGILHTRVPDAAQGGAEEVEIFALPVPEHSGLAAVADAERAADHEAHTAFDLPTPDDVVLAGLSALLTDRAGARADGGGYNAHENATVLYFRTDRHRLELYAAGEHTAALAAHLRRSAADATAEPADRLLRQLTGAWETQAIAVAAELRLADLLDAHPGATAAQLAAGTGTHAESLGRLLRYLASLGLLTRHDGDDGHDGDPGDVGYRLTATGRLLHADTPESLRPLALLYGGTFYQSFGHLRHAVRTGEEAFAELFGEHHFPYFARKPESADLFDRAMAASARMFGPVAELVDFSAAELVVDVAGGNGTLLGRVLRAAPHLRGLLLERPHAIEAARTALGAAGVADRCAFVAGDFTASVPAGGDVYILSRVLHDWDDRRCAEILGRVADAMAPGSELLVVERLLPADDSPSLAVAWDVHMLCNVGGRERTEAHYARLLADAGFDLVARHDLPLDGALLRARRR
ncbi:methyltransferase [Kitasatospora sp. NPDC048365]|uniref:methyltransferase n=1 Tax=Kitasatospora sp. NPDC048365 TaxID=3364050 RepID=UPI003716A106